MNIALLLEMAADAAPDRIALVCDGRRWTYGALLSAVRGAVEVIADSGAETVALLDESSEAALIALFAAALAGVPPLPPAGHHNPPPPPPLGPATPAAPLRLLDLHKADAGRALDRAYRQIMCGIVAEAGESLGDDRVGLFAERCSGCSPR